MIKIFYSYVSKEKSYEMLFHILSAYYSIEATDKDLLIGVHGKPSIKGAPYFNISHTDGLVMIAFSSSEVGIDVEFIKDRNYELVAKRAFPEIEPKSLKDFYLFWTKKESVIKYLGESGYASISKIRFENGVCLFGEKKLKSITNSFKMDDYIYSVTGEEENYELILLT